MLQGTEKINKNYYNEIYQSKFGSFFSLLKTLTSYDQQSKSKLNLYYVKKYLDQNKSTLSILDYGFGRGSLLLKMPSNFKLYGCEISEYAVSNFPKIAKIIGKEVKTFLPENFESEVEEDSIDIIFCSHVLEHVPDDILILKKFYKKIKFNGYVLINIPINEIWDDPKHVRKYSFLKFNEIAINQGFNVVEYFETNQMDNFILTNEILKRKKIITKVLFKSLRLFLAILPLKILNSFNSYLSKSYDAAQLICILQKKKNGIMNNE